jgi:hypothetical protein
MRYYNTHGIQDKKPRIAYLVRHLPPLERRKVVEQHRRKVRRQSGAHVLERLRILHHRADLVEALQQGDGAVVELLLERAHRLEDVVRAVDDHVRREEDAHIHVLRCGCPRWRAVAEGREKVDALEARLGPRNGARSAEVEDELVEAVDILEFERDLCV